MSLQLQAISLKDFRCYSQACFEFSPGINTICGPNAKGKTSILEAIYVLIAGRSFRTSQFSDLIRIGAPGFSVEALFVKHGVQQTLKFAYDGKDKRIIYNSTVFSSSSNLLGILPGIALTPDDVALVKGGPIVRRHFLDLQISQVDPLYVHHLMRYHRGMRQRNLLLKRKIFAGIESWEEEMATSAAYLTKQRSAAVIELQGRANRFHNDLSGSVESVSLAYKTNAPEQMQQDCLKQYFLQSYTKHRPRELIFGSTLVGPQKDDLSIAINQCEARFFGSEGQQRCCATALRLAEWERVSEHAEVQPLMLMDDIGVSLDDSRRKYLVECMPKLGQVFITSTQSLNINESKLIQC